MGEQEESVQQVAQDLAARYGLSLDSGHRRYPVPVRIVRVMVAAGRHKEEYGARRTRQRWIVNDFRLGTFRSRGDAVRAARGAGLL